MATKFSVNSSRTSTKEIRPVSDRKLKIGIIGTGWIAESHVESYKRMKDVEIVALADLIEEKRSVLPEDTVCRLPDAIGRDMKCSKTKNSTQFRFVLTTPRTRNVP